MSRNLQTSFSGARLPVALVLALTAVTLLTTPLVEASLAGELGAVAMRLDPGSVADVKAESAR